MDDCPFLTTTEEKVECFRECVFFKEKGNHNLCPFKRLESSKNTSAGLYEYVSMKDDENDIIEHYKKYIGANF
ncbi:MULTISPECIES: hypothetical protein [Clostridium]|uniref:hypothetical protein n=1 Tax=Clostridium TaxID=1485 RepID=UPI00069D70D8|nr:MULTISPECIES: hypothetical protein [Clostridium]KOF56245.1 hypothetical protein AGR56_05075 [Clostridium sp. DMHC 10]MCD2346484.1 hypothetical protein [Clostridium guangxiense]